MSEKRWRISTGARGWSVGSICLTVGEQRLTGGGTLEGSKITPTER